MNIHKINTTDVANGPGVRVSVFVSGCDHRCPGCFNPETWDRYSGRPFTDEDLGMILYELTKDTCSGLTLLGGDPMMPYNQEGVYNILEHVVKIPGKTIWLYTGDRYEELLTAERMTPFTNSILNCIDVLVDGPFVESLKDFRLKFRGSSNQRLIDVRQTRKNGNIVLFSLDK